MKTTEENNKLIAEFMNVEKTYSVIEFNKESGDVIHSKNLCMEGAETDKSHYDYRYNIECEIVPTVLEYHTSWDWLMPVVDKIESIGNNSQYSLEIYRSGCVLHLDEPTEDVQEYWLSNRMLSVYAAVIFFIKWYNENKTN